MQLELGFFFAVKVKIGPYYFRRNIMIRFDCVFVH